jgi:hypothetical protein
MDNINDFENDMRTHGELDEIFKKLLRENEEEVIQIFIRFLRRSLNGLSFDVNGQNYSLASESNISGDIEGRELDFESRTDLSIQEIEKKQEQEESHILDSIVLKETNKVEQEYRTKIQGIENELQLEIDKRKKIELSLDDYVHQFSDILQVLELYRKFSQEIQDQLKGIFGLGEGCEVVVALSKWGNIQEIWNFAKRRIIESPDASDTTWNEFFKSCFKIFQKTNRDKKIDFINPEKESKYDSDYESSIGIKTDGTVEKLLLVGVKDSVKQEIVFKAVVKLK